MYKEILLMIVLIIIGFIIGFITTEFEINFLYWVTTFVLSFTIITRRIWISLF